MARKATPTERGLVAWLTSCRKSPGFSDGDCGGRDWTLAVLRVPLSTRRVLDVTYETLGRPSIRMQAAQEASGTTWCSLIFSGLK